MMLTRISVKGFKSLADVEVELGQVNVFVGANGSGKTNFLESVALLSAVFDTRNPAQFNSRAILERGARPDASFSSFDEIVNKDVLSIKATTETDLNISLSAWRTDSEYLFFSTIADYAVFSPNTSVLCGTMSDFGQRKPVGLSGGQLAEAVEDLLDNERGMFGSIELDDLFELLDWVDEIAVVRPSHELLDSNVPALRSIIRFTDRRISEGCNQFSAYNASEGALYVLFALALAMHPDSPELFAIDNFDHAMHPRLARATTRAFCDQMLKTDPPRQALLTTHNPLTLDGLDLRDDRIRLFTVERNDYGATEVHRVQVSDKVLQSTDEKGFSLSRLWIMGRLGGVPDLF
ncbi:AAA family ATPase [Desulfobacterales bacterium HSG2]|nr:AAA family ATPase [Desulfobacterales bacterium HSG2]